MDTKGTAGDLTTSRGVEKQFRRTCAFFVALLLLYVPFMFCLGMVMIKWFRTSTLLGYILSGIWVTAWMISGLRMISLGYRLKRPTQL